MRRTGWSIRPAWRWPFVRCASARRCKMRRMPSRGLARGPDPNPRSKPVRWLCRPRRRPPPKIPCPTCLKTKPQRMIRAPSTSRRRAKAASSKVVTEGLRLAAAAPSRWRTMATAATVWRHVASRKSCASASKSFASAWLIGSKSFAIAWWIGSRLVSTASVTCRCHASPRFG